VSRKTNDSNMFGLTLGIWAGTNKGAQLALVVQLVDVVCARACVGLVSRDSRRARTTAANELAANEDERDGAFARDATEDVLVLARVLRLVQLDDLGLLVSRDLLQQRLGSDLLSKRF